MRMKITLLLVVGHFLSPTNALRVLGIFIMAAQSHFSCDHAVMKSLHDAGHHITMVTPFPSEKKVENFTYINSRFDSGVSLIGQSTIDEFQSMTFKLLIEWVTRMELEYCRNVMKLTAIQEALNLSEKRYDVMFIEILLAHDCYLPIAEKLGIPVIGVVTSHIEKTADLALGIPNSPALFPMAMSAPATEMRFFQRVESLWNDLVFNFHYKTERQNALDKFYSEHFDKEVLHKKDISLIFYNNHASLLSRPITLNAVEVGGIHVKPAKPLPKTFLLVVLRFLSPTNALRVLGIFTMAGQSHFSCNHAVMKSLHDAGHHITMVTPFPSEKKIENFTYIDSRFDSGILVGQSTIDDFQSMTFKILMEWVTRQELEYCRNVMKLTAIQEALNSSEKLYDVMFTEILVVHDCYLPIAEKLGIPVIGVVTLHTVKTADHALGIPNSPALFPMAMSVTATEMSFFQRFESLWNDLIFDYVHKTERQNGLDEFYSEHFDKELLYKKDISLIFYNNHASLLSRPITPNAVEVGGIHLKPAKPLPKDLQKFIDEATHGVVLFTFGSVVRVNSLPPETKDAFLHAFAAIPQRVIWKFEEPIKNLPENIMISDWLPQRDILEHKNVIAFMSHCGQSGTYEAVVTATPVVAIPLFGDQPVNSAMLLRHKVAVYLDLKTVTKEAVLNALNTIINDTSYYERMQVLSRVFKDRPMSPQQSIVYWTEYVVRHNGTRYLKALGADMPLYKYFMLDIAALALIIMSAMVFMVYVIIRNVYILVWRQSKYAIMPKKDQ